MSTDPYGQGRWGTGSRPLETGPAQSAWDQGAQDRRNEEFRRQQQMRDDMYRRQKEQQLQREEEYRRNRLNSPTAPGDAARGGDDGDAFEGLILIAAIGGFTYLTVFIWNAFVGQFNPTNGVLSAVVQHGAWAVGAAGVVTGVLLQDILTRLVKIILLLAVLFLGSAVAVGIYQGITGAG